MDLSNAFSRVILTGAVIGASLEEKTGWGFSAMEAEQADRKSKEASKGIKAFTGVISFLV
ncbi:hypothetical protein U6B65_09370 [Oscillospiraceae bacterium MB08-C2-2]|nr:hypothetical protein U6B65_09370 [Oscillospiraceae bacterium MB08-C2-2]